MSIGAEIIERVLGLIDPDELIGLTTDLVRINSVWDPEAGTSEQEAAMLAARWCEERGFKVEIDQVAPGRPNVVVSWKAGSGDKNLMFEGHTDVVTPGDLEKWHYDPFEAQIVGRRMYGRGTNDTKGNLAAMLVAADALKRSGLELAGSILCGVLCDEEDRMLGVLDFIERGRADAVTAAVICEPQDGLICTSQKGAIRVAYTIEGRMAHGAMPLSGLNTAPAVARLIDGLSRLELEAVDRHGRHEHLGWPSFTPTVIKAPLSGSPQLNVIPDQARILVDVRTIPSQSHEEVKQDLLTLAGETAAAISDFYREYDVKLGVERDPFLTVETDFLTDRPCTLTDPDHPIVKAAQWATTKAAGREPTLAGVPGATDGTFLWALKDIPIVTMGAGDRQVPHQKDEWVDLDQLVETAKIYALTALHYLWP